MPPLPGEERMLTVFADIHSYFEEPSPKPIHHRFDKGSYLYVYHDATQHKSRIEVANNPGSPDQDAFNGALDRIHLCHSTRFPTLCTLTVDGPDPNPQSFPPPPNAASLYEWRLPSNDPRDEQGDLLRLHTLDIYFWQMDDVNEFLDLMEHLLPPSQIESDRHPPPLQPENGTDNNNVSSVVQQLENVAVTDPAYQNEQTPYPNRTPDTQGTVIPPPPPPASTAAPAAPVAPAVAQGPSPTQQTRPIPQPAAQEQPAPLPYNPAAPAAPEPIQHREKTPPPADGADGTGLAAAVAADNGMPYTPPSQTPGGSFAPPPSLPTTQGQDQVLNYQIPGTYASPPPSAGLPPSSAPGLTHSGSLSSRSSSVQGPPPGVMSAYAPSPSSPFFPGNTQQQPLNRAGSISFAPPPQPQPQDPAVNPNQYLYHQQQQQLQQQQQQHHQQQLAQQQPQQQLPQQYLYGPQGQPQLQPQLFHPQLQQQQLPQQPTTATLTPPIGSYPTATPTTTTTMPFTNEHDLNNPHNQAQAQALYRSVEAEQKLALQQQQQQQQQQVIATNGAGARGGGDAAGEAPRGGKLENRAARVESGVNRFLKKLEKRL